MVNDDTIVHDPRGEMGISPFDINKGRMEIPPDPDNMGISPFALGEELFKHKPDPTEHSDI